MKGKETLPKQEQPSIAVSHVEKQAPKTGPIAKIKNAKDTIPIAKTPKRQKSSRFHVSEKVELEKLPSFKGRSFIIVDVPLSERHDLFVRKLQQCCVMFDFNDTLGDLKGKEIKRMALNECVEYVSSNRGVLNDAIYPDLMKMVPNHL
jgi:serine/threonine-protein phosphatase 2A regulatory subunit B'